MRNCQNCGTPLIDGAKYCHNCGNPDPDNDSGMPGASLHNNAIKNFDNDLEKNEQGNIQIKFFNKNFINRRNKMRRTWLLLLISTLVIIIIYIVIYILSKK